jgi:response regulator RpfG family c-di-GMP phosphodiesterase
VVINGRNKLNKEENYPMALAKILWVDDEIESLQSQKMFLENKGYEVFTLTMALMPLIL